MSDATAVGADESTWAVHFPGNLRWSNAMQIVKGMVPYGAVAMDEVDRVGRRLKARAGEADLDRVWREEWAAMADRVAAVADKAAEQGREITAGNHYMRAGNYYYSAERFIPPGPDKMAMYHKALRAYEAAMARLHPDIERVEVPYENTSLPAYFVKGAGGGRRPTVVLFDGMDNAKEMSVIFAGLDFAKRGINTLAIDGPGQAETLRLRNIVSRHDYEVPARPPTITSPPARRSIPRASP
jgi:Esterase FrsA-like